MNQDDPKKAPRTTNARKEQRGVQAALQAYLDESRHPADALADDGEEWHDIEHFLHDIDDSLAALDEDHLSGAQPFRSRGARSGVPFQGEEPDGAGGTHQGVPTADLAAHRASGGAVQRRDPMDQSGAGRTFDGVVRPSAARGSAPPQAATHKVGPDDDERAAWDAYAGTDAHPEAHLELRTSEGRDDVPTAVSEEVPPELLRSLHGDDVEVEEPVVETRHEPPPIALPRWEADDPRERLRRAHAVVRDLIVSLSPRT